MRLRLLLGCFAQPSFSTRAGEVAETFGMVEFDDVALSDQCGEALAEVVLILIQRAAKFGHGGHPCGAKGNEGLLLAAGEIGQVHDRLSLGQRFSERVFVPIVHSVEGKPERSQRILASLQGVLDALAEGRPRRIQEGEVFGGQALQDGIQDFRVIMLHIIERKRYSARKLGRKSRGWTNFTVSRFSCQVSA